MAWLDLHTDGSPSRPGENISGRAITEVSNKKREQICEKRKVSDLKKGEIQSERLSEDRRVF